MNPFKDWASGGRPGRDRATGDPAHGDGQRQVLLIAGVLWFGITLAVGVLIGAAASGEIGRAASPAEIDWGAIWRIALAWVAFLNVPVWGLAWWRQRRMRDEG
ncbi:MAG: hypothetical protein AAFQ43_10290 [Bacteroidota bacterium]